MRDPRHMNAPKVKVAVRSDAAKSDVLVNVIIVSLLLVGCMVLSGT